MKINKTLLGILVGLAMASGVHAAMYRCTDAAGNTSFTDKPCPTQKQQVLKERRYSVPEEKSTDAAPLPNAAGFSIDPIRPLAGGRKVTRSSPLAKAYRKALGVFKRCDRSEIKAFAKKGGKGDSPDTDIDSISNSELKEHCKEFRMLFPAPDFEDATEVIEGDKGTIQWLTVDHRKDGKETATMRSGTTLNFVKENGEWKLR